MKKDSKSVWRCSGITTMAAPSSSIFETIASETSWGGGVGLGLGGGEGSEGVGVEGWALGLRV
jgi:hypothetical protein